MTAMDVVSTGGRVAPGVPKPAAIRAFSAVSACRPIDSVGRAALRTWPRRPVAVDGLKQPNRKFMRRVAAPQRMEKGSVHRP